MSAIEVCWCSAMPKVVHPFQISHNDAVAHLGGCLSHRGVGAALPACNVPTERRWADVFVRLEREAQDRRVHRGQIRSGSDVTRAIRLGVLPRR
jgi:hypothetical protein